MGEVLNCDHSKLLYFSLVLFSMLYEVIVTFDSVDEDHKSKILDAVFSVVIQLVVLSFLGGSSVHSPERRSSSMFVAILLCFNLCSLYSLMLLRILVLSEKLGFLLLTQTGGNHE